MTENKTKLVVIAGGTGGIGRHIVNGIVDTKKYIVKVFTRQDPLTLLDLTAKGVNVIKVNYSDHQSLVFELQGVHTVISCFIGIDESAMKSQLNLLDACLEAKVKRFAPSEWSSNSDANSAIQLYRELKIPVRNKIKASGIEFTVFMPGLFMDYFASPQRASPSLPPYIVGVDFNKCEANIVGTGDEPFCTTRADDVGRFVAAALDLDKWDEKMGMVGSRTTWNQLIKLGEQIRGKKFDVKRMTIDETLKQCDLISTNRMMKFMQEAFIAMAQGESDFEAILNAKFPEIQPMTIDEFLTKWWGDKKGQIF
ncbi:unnamed protein product [Rotaria sp. Silwood2]|nr:unnamed protein product [Rotaria sp. Silwood2]CAF3369791.1 unnamed protein product [Rotaria sp. Silwood2]CAF4375526.1 unnamed protein product [Rotaria sp. Silwood2]CAF4509703.1 unnamed protein product [Rotaria sp. Silwood2]